MSEAPLYLALFPLLAHDRRNLVPSIGFRVQSFGRVERGFKEGSGRVYSGSRENGRENSLLVAYWFKSTSSS
jgi:hypothetical protein